MMVSMHLGHTGLRPPRRTGLVETCVFNPQIYFFQVKQPKCKDTHVRVIPTRLQYLNASANELVSLVRKFFILNDQSIRL